MMGVLTAMALALMSAGFVMSSLSVGPAGPRLLAIGVLSVVIAPLLALGMFVVMFWQPQRRLALLALTTLAIVLLGAVIARAP